MLDLIHYIGNDQGIVFCNLKDSIQRVSTFLESKNISHGCFNGGMEQKDRERSLIKFRNGTNQLLIATDLAARVSAKGTAYVLKWKDERLPDFIGKTPIEDISKQAVRKPVFWETLFISGGRKDKISKGDIAGMFFKLGGLTQDQLGIIELKQDCAFVAVPASIANQLVETLNNTRLKKKKVRVTSI